MVCEVDEDEDVEVEVVGGKMDWRIGWLLLVLVWLGFEVEVEVEVEEEVGGWVVFWWDIIRFWGGIDVG